MQRIYNTVHHTQPERGRLPQDEGGRVVLRLHDGQIESTQSYDIVLRLELGSGKLTHQGNTFFRADRPENVSMGFPGGGDWAPGNTVDLPPT